MRHPNYPGVGKRITDRLIALGYVTPKGRPDIPRFIREKHYDARNFYPWTQRRTPSGENLVRLARDLHCSPAYLLFGVEQQAPGEEVKIRRKLALELIGLGYRALAKRLHPDRGGSRDAMARLNDIRDDLTEIASTRKFV